MGDQEVDRETDLKTVKEVSSRRTFQVLHDPSFDLYTFHVSWIIYRRVVFTIDENKNVGK